MPSTRISLDRMLTKHAFDMGRRADFYGDIAEFMASGIPPYQAIEKMCLIASRHRRTRRIAALYRSILVRMDDGASLATAVAKWLPGNEAVMLVGAAKAGPRVLLSALREMASLLNRQIASKKKLQKVLMGNGFTIAIIFGVAAFIILSVLPTLSAATTPKMAAAMSFAPAYFSFGKFLVRYGLFGAMALTVLVVVIALSMSRWTRSRSWLSRKWFDTYVPPWTLYQRTQTTYFLSATSGMMRAGVPLKTVVSDMIPYSSAWMKTHLRRILRDLQSGRREIDALAAGNLLPVNTRERLEVYSLMTDFTDIMSTLAEANFKLFERTIDVLSAVLPIISMLLMVTFVGATLFAIFDFSNALTAANGA